MARATDITWAGGEHPFLLDIPLLRALQTKCDAGPNWVLARLSTQQWMVDDIISTIQFGLEGGGMPKADARKLVQNYVEDRPLTESLKTAQMVLMSTLYSTDEDDNPSGEARAGTQAV